MANHISHASLPYPVKNARYSLIVPLVDGTGTPTDPTTPDTEVAIDGANTADATEELTVITSMPGQNLITFTGAEMDCSALAFQCKAASGPKTVIGTIYPRILPTLFSCTATAGANGTITLPSTIPLWAQQTDMLKAAVVRTTGGTGGGGTGGANNQARVITSNTNARVVSIAPNWETNPSSDTTVDILMTPEWAAGANFTRTNGTISVGVVGNSSTSTAVVVSNISPAITVDNQLAGSIIKFSPDTATANLRNCSARILSVSNSAQTLTLVAADALPASPASGDTFVVL